MSDIPPETLSPFLSPLSEPELLVDILSRLPVKSLLQFRSVSKPWRSLIDSSYFIKIHINHSIKTNKNLNIVFGGESQLFTVPFDSLKFVKPLKNPLFSDDYGTAILGSCNGVLCLSTMTDYNEMALFNPSTRKFKKVPFLPVNFPLCSSRRFCIEGFGYDSINDDYKVVRVVQSVDTYSGAFDSMIRAYSLKSGLWRKVRDFPYYLCYQRSYSVFAGGCLHWVVKGEVEQDVDRVIVGFDLGTEEYRVVPQPEYLYKKFEMSLHVMGGCLCVLYDHSSGVDVWMMKSYGVKESWHKLISIPSAKKSFKHVRLLAYSESSGKVLMEEDMKRLVWYDLKTKTVKRVKLHGMASPFVADVYLGSLAQLNSGSASASGSGAKKQQAEKKKNVKRDDFLSKGFKLAL